jgi:nucleoside-diphosphate-sugar epimerase
MTGALPQFNLAKAKEQFGEKAALYTLQVGVYGRRDLPNPKEADLKEVRKTAEEAAAKLRKEGELAFYYHGPTMSMVTIGVYDEKDFDPQIPNFESQRLREAKKRNPLNLYNGAGVKIKPKGSPATMQPSGLVEIPKS